jgi:magnesium transporter
MRPPKTVHIIEANNFKWINITQTTEEELLYLEKNYHFHPLDIKECLPPLQRAKLIPRPDYLFLILIFPVFNRTTREIEPEEVDFFIKKDFVITIHNDKIQALQNFYEILDLNQEYCQELMKSPTYFLAQLLDELFDSCFPMLVHISNDIEALRKQVIKDYTKETIYEILRLKNNIVSFRKAMHAHHDLILRLQNLLPTYFPTLSHPHYYQRLVDHSKEIQNNLETYSYAIEALYQTHTTLLSLRLNEIVKTLTIFSIILFLSNFVATIFIIPAKSLPLIGKPYDFWIIIGFIFAAILGALGFFRKKGWL